MRLIDADELREHIVYADISTDAVDALMGALDAVPVVKCEDCKHWRRDLISHLNTTDRLCERARFLGIHVATQAHFGCSLFERRDDD